MKKLLALFLCACLTLSLAGCFAQDEDTSAPQTTATAPDVIIDSPTEPYHPEELAQPMHAVVLPTVTEAVLADDGVELFTLSYQKAQIILNGTNVEDVVIGDLQSRMGTVLSGASELQARAQEDYTDAEYWTPYFINVSYTPTRLDQAVMSLFGNLSTYSGGPHPGLVTDSVTYDLKTGSVLTLKDILAEGCDGQQLSNVVIKTLSGKAGELYYDYDIIIQEQFAADLTTVNTWYFSHNGLCFHFAPYLIAPYSSGTIIAEIPYADLKDVLLEQYLPTELEDVTGSMYAEQFLEDDNERFTFTADVALANEGHEVLLYSDATVTDVRIEVGSWFSDSSKYIATSTVFAADSVGIGNAIKLTANLADENTVYRLVYHSGGQEISAYIVYDADGDSVLLTHG